MPTKQVTTQVAPVSRVMPGHSVCVGELCFRPGETVTLSPEDAARLSALGFVQLVSESDGPTSSDPTPGASVQVQDGAQVTQG